MLIEGLVGRIEQLTVELQSLSARVATLEFELAAAFAKNTSSAPATRVNTPASSATSATKPAGK